MWGLLALLGSHGGKSTRQVSVERDNGNAAR
jgi:hypothetical protein